jgi:hypothetical protein
MQRPVGEQRQWLPTQNEWERIRSQQKLIEDDVSARYGVRLTGELSDLPTLQRLLNEGVYPVDKTYELQSMGLCFGEVMVKNLGFHWITVDDDLGSDPAIQYQETSIIAYLLTMVSKRVEDGVEIDLRAIYSGTAQAVLRMKDEVDPSAATSTWWTRVLTWIRG